MEKALKRECNQQCAALLIYKLIMTVVVTVTMLVIVLTDLFTQLPYLTDPDEMMTYMMDGVAQAASSGWGYLIAIVIGLAAIVMGEVIFGRLFKNFALKLAAVRMGAIIYYIVIQAVLAMGLNSNYLKLLSAAVVAIFLSVPYWKSKVHAKPARKEAAKNA